MQFKEGDQVEYKGDFLRSVGWFTNVPRNGQVTRVVPVAADRQLVEGIWGQPAEGAPPTFKVLNVNLEKRP